MGPHAIDAQVDAVLLKKKVGQLFALLKPSAKHSLEQRMSMETSMSDLNLLFDCLLESPEKITPCLGMVRRTGFGANTLKVEGQKSGDASKFFSDKYTTFKKIPKTFLWQFYVQLYPNVVTPRLIELIEGKDPEAIRKIAEFDMGRKDSSQVPPACHEKQVLHKALSVARTAMKGRCSAIWWAEAVGADGSIDWSVHGVYRWNATFTSVKHIGGTTADVPVDFAPLLLKAKGNINQNWKDLDATVDLGCTDFKPHTSFHQIVNFDLLTNGYFKDLVEKIVTDKESAELKTKEGEVVITDDVATACKRRRRNAPAVGPSTSAQV